MHYIDELPHKYKFRLVKKHDRIIGEFFKFKKGDHIMKTGYVETLLTKYKQKSEKNDLMII
jgi:hypothetical protein